MLQNPGCYKTAQLRNNFPFDIFTSIVYSDHFWYYLVVTTIYLVICSLPHFQIFLSFFIDCCYRVITMRIPTGFVVVQENIKPEVLKVETELARSVQ